ncbi:MAG: glycerol-3-phosphate 1-O-acyltransferase PlsY [Crocinitomicaceae bacterium]|jgi:glycerol-3-phosphate acyltransferase PlsY|nr:glycerol-3-phosphate 1-O-acyltransferase PlsY [Crocinitomicaceae bacterium]MDG1741982.1 glycerol-3-phosphate 1-O-acyltransferase PlsY [Crocinitomicaceae bacterium]
MMDFILFAISAYLLGSIPTAIWLGKAKYGIDVREHGSNNAGATNTFRVLGKKPGVVVLFIDILKGFIAVFLPFIFGIGEWGSNHLIEVQLVAALCAVSGHVLPIFANFRGGKGVATSLGVIVGVHPIAAGICVAVFLIVFVISKYVSLGAMIAACCFPILLAFYFKVDSVWLLSFSVLLSAVVVYVHKKNIGRLLRKEENKMNLFKK